jgi:hypothetical protein
MWVVVSFLGGIEVRGNAMSSSLGRFESEWDGRVGGRMRMASVMIVAVLSLSLCGCSSEVDKCVSDWEKAYPGPENVIEYCQLYMDSSGKCQRDYAQIKAQARADRRLICLRWARGR